MPRLYSIFYSPVALGVGAVSHSWESCWLVAPVCHALQVFELFKYCKCVGALFWACDINEDRSFRSDVVEFLYVAKGKRIFVHVAIKNCGIGSDKFILPAIFLRINGASEIQAISCSFCFISCWN